MKIIAYMPLHYGREYLKESIQSIEPFIDKLMIFYTHSPSYGHRSTVPVPETEDELRTIALDTSNKVVWSSGKWGNEGEHRGEIYKHSSGYDIVISIDSDEVFEQNDLPAAIETVASGSDRYYGVNGYIHFWKSFNRRVTDFYRPVRFTNLHRGSGQGEVRQTIYHFTCAQSKEIMEYKYLVHGHFDEIKKDYLRDIYYAWNEDNQIRYLHPTSNTVWLDAEPFDKSTLPDCLKKHPNFHKDIIS